MLYKTAKSAIFPSLALGLFSITNQIALAAGECTLNGQEVDCGELWGMVKGFLGWGIGIFLLFSVLGILATVFWIMMIVHAATHDIKDKTMWILIIVFSGLVGLGLIGALVYYFVVKRNFATEISATTANADSKPKEQLKK